MTSGCSMRGVFEDRQQLSRSCRRYDRDALLCARQHHIQHATVFICLDRETENPMPARNRCDENNNIELWANYQIMSKNR